MKRTLLIGVAVLLLTAGTAHAGDALVCGVEQGSCKLLKELSANNQMHWIRWVLETSDNFLAMRWHPTTKSGIVWALRQGEGVIAGLEDQQFGVFLARREHALPKNWKNWVYVHTRDRPGHALEGWVYKKYIKEVPCSDKDDLHGHRQDGMVPIPGMKPGIPTMDDK